MPRKRGAEGDPRASDPSAAQCLHCSEPGTLGTLADQSLLIWRRIRLEGLESGHVGERRCRGLEGTRALAQGRAKVEAGAFPARTPGAFLSLPIFLPRQSIALGVRRVEADARPKSGLEAPSRWPTSSSSCQPLCSS